MRRTDARTGEIVEYLCRKGYTEAEALAVAEQPPALVYPSGVEARPLPRPFPFVDADPSTGLGPCACEYCSPTRLESRMEGAWDTVNWSPDPHYRAWAVHHPALHGRRRRRKDV